MRLRLLARVRVVACVTACALAPLGCGGDSSRQGPPEEGPDSSGMAPVVDRVRVLAEFPHDTGAFTQGLVFEGGKLYEGTGLFGRSTLRRVELSSGRVEQSVALAPAFFGEGIAIVGDTIYQVTFQSGRAFSYDRATLAPRGTFTYPGDGWGLTTDGESLILSDGTSRLRFLDPTTFRERRSVFVTGPADPVARLNELELVEGEIWANIWERDTIVRIDPATGAVRGVVDLTALARAEPRADDDRENVLNGIAYDAAAKRLFVTGKRWSRVYQIELTR